MALHEPKIASLEPEMVAFGGPFVLLEGPLVATEEHQLASEKLKVASTVWFRATDFQKIDIKMHKFILVSYATPFLTVIE